jgi:crotonobetainyl-CoA:carnitine CoA-transferase CaiB-like acyl-CoA transferase
MRAGASLCDQGSGMWAVIGILSLLQRRAITQRGGIVNTSLLETALVWNAQKSDAWRNEGALPQRHRSGHPGLAPYEAFDTADGPLVICCGNNRLFAKLAAVLGHTAWVDDARFRNNRDRLSHKAELLAEMAPLLRLQTRAQWTARFRAAGVPCAPVNSIAEALAEAQVAATGLLQPVPGEGFSLTGTPISIDGQRPAMAGAAPRLGEHNADFGIVSE